MRRGLSKFDFGLKFSRLQAGQTMLIFVFFLTLSLEEFLALALKALHLALVKLCV